MPTAKIRIIRATAPTKGYKNPRPLRKVYEELYLTLGTDVAGAVAALLERKEAGVLAWASFNGHHLYSDTVTLNKAYQEILGCTHEEYLASQRDWRTKQDEAKKAHLAEIPQLTERWVALGKEILPQDKWEEWEKIVPARLEDIYWGSELGYCLDLVKALSEGKPFAEVEQMLEAQGHSGFSHSLVLMMVKNFAPRGKGFESFVNLKVSGL